MSRRARARARAKRAHSRRQVLGERQEAERCHAETSVACCVCGGRIRGALCWSRNGPAHWGCQQQGNEPVAKHIWRHGGPKIWRRCRFWWSPSLRRSVRRARRRLRLPPQACQQQQLAAERAAVRLRNHDCAPRSGPELHEAWRRGAPCNDVDETLAIRAARGAPLALAQLEGDDAGVVQHTLADASAGGASSSRLLQQATHRARKKSLERLLLVVVLNAVLAFTARVSAAWVACCTSYAVICLRSRLAPHAHGSHR